MATAPQVGIKFENGEFTIDGAHVSIENLDIYNDGIVATARNTSDAEAILDDAIEWGMETFGLRRPEKMLPRTYTSWVVVDFEEPIAQLFSKFDNLRTLITKSFEETYKRTLDFQMQRIAFNVDPQLLPPYTQTDFAIDRRGGSPYSLNRFFCSAPLKTDSHIALLEGIEATLR